MGDLPEHAAVGHDLERPLGQPRKDVVAFGRRCLAVDVGGHHVRAAELVAQMNGMADRRREDDGAAALGQPLSVR
jgi:hypothetical protein